MVGDTLSSPSTDASLAPASAPVSSPSASALVSPVSPLPSSSDVPSFDFSLLPLLQLSCPSVLQEMKLSPSLSVVAIPRGAGSLFCDSSTGSLHPLVPQQLQRQLFNLLHDVSHRGVHVSRRLISTKFVWPGLSRDVGLGAKSCLQCQRSKISTHFHSSFLFPPRGFLIFILIS